MDKDNREIDVALETEQFSEDEQLQIVRMVKQDIVRDLDSMSDWIEQRKKDLQQYYGEKPSIIESLSKDDWMSDRNLGICAANCDAYQATLLSTCYNIDTLHFISSEFNDKQRKEQLEQFAKWGLGEKECNFYPEVDDFIHNKITQGVSYFYIYWDVWYEWVDRRIPVYDGEGKFVKYNIKTEEKRFEKGRIENIDDVTDLIYPVHGDTLQKKEHLIHKIKKSAYDIVQLGKKGIFETVSNEYVIKLKNYCFDRRSDILKDEKLRQLGISRVEDMDDLSLRMFPVELYVWYGKFERQGKCEEYRFTIEPNTSKFLAGKPLRKITRSGKRPFVGSSFIRRPGMLQGISLPHLIADPVNAMNNVYNQKSDFQYAENCGWGWFNPDEIYKGQETKIKPGTLFPTSDPTSVNIPNMSRSMAWAMDDFQMLLEVIERLTGAASYFMSNSKGVSGTATRDAIINEKSSTRFGLWVNRIISDISEAMTMWIELYQDWAPPDLGERILGEDGKKLFPNFSIETIRGGYDARISPDIISGSKVLEKEIALWAFQTLSNTIWFMPQFNPAGNWDLVNYVAKKVGFTGIERFMPPKPKGQFGNNKLVKDKWTQLKQGEIPEIEEGDDILQLYIGMLELVENNINELDKEYKPNLEAFMFKLNVAMMQAQKQQEENMMANQMASDMIQGVQSGQIPQQKAELLNA